MHKKYILGVLLITLCLSACKKDEGFKNTGIIGNWQLTAIFDGYLNGGSNKWNKVAFEDSRTLSFTSDGKYAELQNGTGNGADCRGNYEFLYSKVVVTTNCNIEPDTLNISELKPTTLIIDRPGIEGVIRYKFTAVQ